MPFSIGKVVYHREHGSGRVVRAEGGQIIVNFVKAGPKFFNEDAADEELSGEPLEEIKEGDIPLSRPAERGTPSPARGEGKEWGYHREEAMDTDELKEAIREVLREEGLVGATRMAEKWEGGELVMKPGQEGLQEKSVPIETLFHKIVMIRNQLRVLEQNINSNEKLTDREKVDLQQYITRCYGTLTTFNVLFADKKDWFVGSKKE